MPSNPHESEAHPATAPPPEAVLIRRAREACGIGYDRAAEQLKIRLSARRWRQLEEGREYSGGKPAIMTDQALAHMAYVVHVSPERLEEVGRAEAADILREIQRQEEDRPARHYPPDVRRLIDQVEADPAYGQWIADLVATVRGQPPKPPGGGQREDTA